MKKQILLLSAAIILAACQSEAPTESAPETADTSVEAAAGAVSAAVDGYVYTPPQNAVFEGFGWAGFDPANIKTQKIKDDMAVIYGYGGNILVSIGDDGVLMIDSQFPETYAPIMAEIEKLGGSGVDYLINTHWHFDHAEGNRAFGPKGAEIIAHENSRQYMLQNTDINIVQVKYPQQPYTGDALPKVTFTKSMNMAINGEFIELLNFGPAHTTGDTIIWFKNANVVHMGDVGNFGPFPFIDADSGGTIDGMITSVNAVLDRIDDNTVVVPGHGEVADKARLSVYRDNLQTVRDAVAGLKADGVPLSDIQAQAPASMFGEGGAILVDRAYHSLD